MSKKFRRILAVTLVFVMIFSLPSVGFAADASRKVVSNEALTQAETETAYKTPNVSLMSATEVVDSIWKQISEAEKAALRRSSDLESVAQAAYDVVSASSNVQKDSLKWDSEDTFFFTTVQGIPCLYSGEVREKTRNMTAPENYVSGPSVIDFGDKASGTTSRDVYLIAPYYGYDSSFTDQYRLEAQSLAEEMGGTYYLIEGHDATGPAVANAMAEGGIVIFDSHGTSAGGSSYLCLTTKDGISQEEYNLGGVLNGGDAYYIDGSYIARNMPHEANDSFLWMAICECMMTDGLCTPLREVGVDSVYGYSQSVTFVGDYEFEEFFWTEMKNGSDAGAAFEAMQAAVGIYDPYGDAYPILVSDEDAYPENPDADFDAHSDWNMRIPEAISYNVTVEADPESAAVLTYSAQDWNITVDPADGYVLASAEVTPADAAQVRIQGQVIQIVSIDADCTITANLKKVDVQVNDSAMGSASLVDSQIVAVANEGYRIESVSVSPEGAAVLSQNGNVFSFDSLTEDCVVTVTFARCKTLNEALNAEGGTISFTTAETYPWTVVESEDSDYAMSGNAGVNSSSSTVSAMVEIPAGGALVFDWNVSCEARYDKLVFYVDGTEVSTLTSSASGQETGWQSYVYPVSEARTYEVSWTYSKDSSISYGADAGYLDNVHIESEVAQYTVQFVAGENGSLQGETTATLPLGTILTEEMVPTPVPDEGYTIVGWSPSDPVGQMVTEDITYTVTFRPLVVTDAALDAALNAEGGDLIFSSSGDYPWLVAEGNGRTYGASGNAQVNSSSSSVSTTVTIPAGGALVFDWNVSCEKSYDGMTFSVNGVTDSTLTSETSGVETGWQTIVYSVSEETTAEVSWTYSKDSSMSSGEDCGMLDNVMVVNEVSQYTIQFVAGENGTLEGETSLTLPLAYVLTADDVPTPVANEGYRFAGWTPTNPVGQTVTADVTYTANFVEIPENAATIILEAHNVFQDGTGYQMILDADANTYGTVIPTQGAMTSSGDADFSEFEYTIPEGADGSLTSTAIVVDGTATLEIPEGVYDWAICNPTPGDRMWISSNNGFPGRYDDYLFESGKTYHFTISLVEENDYVDLVIEGENTDPIPDADHNLEGYTVVMSEGFESGIPSTWTVEDRDGDGFGWGIGSSEGSPRYNVHHGTMTAVSASYDNDSFLALSPDNWLITPEMEVGEGYLLSFSIVGQDESYAAEKLGLFVSVDGADFVQIGSDYTATAAWRTYTVDVSAYAGSSVKFAFVHHNISDMFMINLDCIHIYAPEESAHLCDAFADIDGHWAKPYICYMVENLYMNGIAQDLFAPDAAVTRAEIATVLYRIAGSPAVEGTTSFTDVNSDAWYYDIFVWAEQNGIFEGYLDGTVNPERTATREEMAVMLYRFLGEPEVTGELTAPDADQVNSWAVDALLYLTQQGIINGVDEQGTLLPQDFLTRAQLAKIFAVMLNPELG